MWYLFWFVGILLMCALHAGAGLAGVAAEIILRVRWPLSGSPVYSGSFLSLSISSPRRQSAVPGYRNYPHRATDRRQVEVSGFRRR